MCPTTFPPIISLPRGPEILAERDAEDPLVLTVAVRENDVTVPHDFVDEVYYKSSQYFQLLSEVSGSEKWIDRQTTLLGAQLAGRRMITLED